MLRGIITLSTPFILCRRRNVGRYRIASLTWLCLSMLGIMTYMLSSKIFGRYGYIISSVGSIFFPPIILAFGAVFIENSAARLRSLYSRLTPTPLLSRITALLRGVDLATLAKSFELALPANGGLFIVRAPGDEASAALMTSYIVAWTFTRVGRFLDFPFSAGNRILRYIDTLIEGVEKLKSNIPMLVHIAIVVTCVVVTFFNSYYLQYGFFCGVILYSTLILSVFLFSDMWVILVMIPYTVGVLLILLSGLLFLPLLLLLSLVLTPFGLDCALLAPYFELTSEATPLGSHRMLLTSPATVVGLWHSTPYQDYDVYNQICDWITARSDDAPNEVAHDA